MAIQKTPETNEEIGARIQADTAKAERCKEAGITPPPELLDRLANDHVELIGSFGAFEQLCIEWDDEVGSGEFGAAICELHRTLVARRERDLDALFLELKNWPRWNRLRHDPTEFSKKLGAILRDIRVTMKTGYGIPSHRPRVNDELSQQIHFLRRKGKTWGRIGIELEIDPNAAERAYDRFVKQQRARFRKHFDTTYSMT